MTSEASTSAHCLGLLGLWGQTDLSSRLGKSVRPLNVTVKWGCVRTALWGDSGDSLRSDIQSGSTGHGIDQYSKHICYCFIIILVIFT